MEFAKLIDERRSVRAYQQREVEDDKLRLVLHAANRAPSAGDLQAYGIVVVRDGQAKRALAGAAYDQLFVSEAPIVLVFLARPSLSAVKYGSRGRALYCVQDATIACAYAQLAAHDLGLGACWVGAFRDEAVCEIVGCSSDELPVALLPLGYPAERPEPTPRRRLEELARSM
ncbi:MAG: nitroreductase family protein [Dehalococcoidia bacterium]|nr:nitroreductase family protein [Dehalococcoidia bacterium]